MRLHRQRRPTEPEYRPEVMLGAALIAAMGGILFAIAVWFWL